MEIKSEEKVVKLNPFFNYEITNDFVGVFDNVFTPNYCNSWIDKFETASAKGLTYDRLQAFNRPEILNKDDAIDYANLKFYTDDDIKIECAEFNGGFWTVCYKLYAEKYSILTSAAAHKIYNVKMQRTQPQGGYHMWHFESATREHSSRLLTFIVYLNDIQEGGETEFLYLSKRVQAKTGRVIIFPAGYTHTHRGNPPLNQNKYILTGWVEY